MGKDRHADVLITRLRLGKCCLNAYLHAIERHATGKCEYGCWEDETVEHYVLRCQSGNNKVANSVREACQIYGLELNLKTVLNDERLRKILLQQVDRKI